MCLYKLSSSRLISTFYISFSKVFQASIARTEARAILPRIPPLASHKQSIMATFSPFPRLPVELQLLVWQFAGPACIFKLGWDRSTPQPAHRAILNPIDPMSHACRASREVMLKGVVGGSFPSSAGLFTFYDGVTARNEGFHFLSKLDTLWVPSGEHGNYISCTSPKLIASQTFYTMASSIDVLLLTLVFIFTTSPPNDTISMISTELSRL